MRWLLSNASSKDTIDCSLKGKHDTKMFKNNLFIKRNRNYKSSKDIDCLLKGKCDTKMLKNDLFIKRNRNY